MTKTRKLALLAAVVAAIIVATVSLRNAGTPNPGGTQPPMDAAEPSRPQANSTAARPPKPVQSVAHVDSGPMTTSKTMASGLNADGTAKSASELSAQREADEVSRLLNVEKLEDFILTLSKEKQWTPGKYEAVVQANSACTSAAFRLRYYKTLGAIIVPPMEMHLANLQAMNTFVNSYCKNPAFAKAGLGKLAPSIEIPYERVLLNSMHPANFKPESLARLVEYARWEPQPQFSFNLVRGAVYEATEDQSIAELLAVSVISGRLSRVQLADAYGLAAEILACEKSTGCNANRPYTMLECMLSVSCKPGQSLAEFRQYWHAPIVWESAQRLADSWRGPARRF